MNYDKRNGQVVFRESDHFYGNLDYPDIKYTSVTTLIGKYEPEFNKEFVSKYKALERLLPSDVWKKEKGGIWKSKKIPKDFLEVYNITEDELNQVQQDILDEWEQINKEACERGTKIHSQLENAFYKAGSNITLKKFGIGGKFTCKKDYTELDLEYGVYPEYLIYYDNPKIDLHIAGQIDLIVKNGNDIVLIDHKGLPLDTPILTSTGWKTMKTLKIGDKVFDKEGNLCNITAKSQIHNNPCYKIKFDNAESMICDIDHKWLVSFRLGRKSKNYPDGYKHQVMTTIELKTYLDSIEKRTTTNIPKILNAKPLNIKKTNLPLDPYLLGAWLGDGSKDCGIITQATNSPLWEEIKARGYEIGENLNHDPERKGVDIRTIFNIRGILNSIGVLKNKHIPEQYLLASYEDRLDLLRGLMDTDGYFHPKRKRFVMTTSFDWQMEGMKQLLSSLGCKVSVFKEIHKCDGKEFPGWNINFTTNKFNPFLIRNQEIGIISIKDNNSFRNIESIEEVEIVPTQCIAVDSPSHTYLAGHSLIVTHNSNRKIDLKGFYNSSTRSSEKLKYPLGTLENCNFNVYQLQLSTYAWMLQKINPDFVIKDLILNHYDHEGKNTLYHCTYLKDEVEKMLKHFARQNKIEQQKKKYERIEY